ncbi:MAG: hypothetical protein ACAH95_12865 [Fimbriimonas sp.]
MEILGAVLGWNLARAAVIASILFVVGCQGQEGANDPVVNAAEFKKKTEAQGNTGEPTGPGAGAAKGAGGK